MTDQLFPGAPVADDARASADPAAIDPRRPPGRALGVAALVLGIAPYVGAAVTVAAWFSSIETFTSDALAGLTAAFGVLALALVTTAFGFLAAVLALVLGALAIRRDRGRRPAIAGIVLGAIAALADIALVIAVTVAGDAIANLLIGT